jgi:multimeric flavodoxin WrbA
MKVLILSFSANNVDEESFIPNKQGLTFACVDECEKELANLGYEVEHICMNKINIKRCLACGEGGWGVCWDEHKCAIETDDFNEIYNHMSDFDAHIFITPVYFWEMSEVAKTFFDRLKRCDAFNDNSKIKGKNIVCIACAGGSGKGTEETLKSFDILNHFLHTNMVGRIPVTRDSFNSQNELIRETIRLFEK